MSSKVSEYTTIHGVRLNINDVNTVNGKVIVSPEMRVSKNGNVEKWYSVGMTDGTSIMFKEQSDGARICVANGRTYFSGFDGFEIYDTEKNDKYELYQCQNGTVHANRENQLFSTPNITGTYSFSYPVATDKDIINTSKCANINILQTLGSDMAYKTLHNSVSIFTE